MTATLLLLPPSPCAASPFVPATGQTASYQSGDDGNLRQGINWPSPRFEDNGDGTVLDTLTGLLWLKNGNCFGPQNWSTALNNSANLAGGGCGLVDGSTSGDWRLPNIRELDSLVTLTVHMPDDAVFSGLSLNSCGTNSECVVTMSTSATGFGALLPRYAHGSAMASFAAW